MKSSFLAFSSPLHYTNFCLLTWMHVPDYALCVELSVFFSNNHKHFLKVSVTDIAATHFSAPFHCVTTMSQSLKFSDNGPTLLTCKSAKFPLQLLWLFIAALTHAHISLNTFHYYIPPQYMLFLRNI